MEQPVYATISIDLRRRGTSNLPIRGISREWAKTFFSVPSVALWWTKVCERNYEKCHLEAAGDEIIE
jgi:hypothetical protein